jgi:hypothetical protein
MIKLGNIPKRNEIINVMLYIIIQASIVGFMTNDIGGRIYNATRDFAVVFRLSGIYGVDSSFISAFFVNILVSVAIFLCVLLIRALYKRTLSLVIVKKLVRLIKRNGLVNVMAFYFIQTFVFWTFMIFGCLNERTSQHKFYLAVFFALWLITGILACSVVFLYTAISSTLFKKKNFAILSKKNAVINTVLYIVSFLLIIKLLVIPIVYQNTPEDAILIFIFALIWSFIISIFSAPLIKGIRFPARRLIYQLKKYGVMNIMSYSFIQAFFVGLSTAIVYNGVRWIRHEMVVDPAIVMLFALVFIYSVLFSLVILLCVLVCRAFVKNIPFVRKY